MKKISLLFIILSLTLCSCITTKSVPEDDQLFTGLKKIAYDEEVSGQHANDMKAEIEAALATAPNGALFGSSYYRMPFSWRLWVFNNYSDKNSKFARWMTRSFGKPPVLISQVNPTLRASVAQSVLRNNGYFRGSITYETVPQKVRGDNTEDGQKKRSKKSKIAYRVHLDSLFTIDSIAYVGFPDIPRQLIDSTMDQAILQKGQPFSLTNLEAERSRITNLFRNNGYYYYNNGYASYLADTIAESGKVQMRLQLADGLPDNALSKWYIGNISIQFRKSFMEQLTDSIQRRHLKFLFSGKSSPVRPRVVLKGLRLFPRQLYSYDRYQESVSKMNANSIFSSMDFQFKPRPDCDTLDLNINCVFDKPYDFYVETNLEGRTIGRYGPEIKVGFVKRNAFRGGEKLDVNLHGSYEWQKSGSSDMNTYQYGADASIEFPRIIAPFYNSERIRRDKNGRPKRRNFNFTPTTVAKVSTDIIRRPDYYRLHIISGEWDYRWNSSEQSRHEFSPLTLKYQYISSITERFDSILENNPYMNVALDDYFIPKMRYTYTYTSPSTLRNPIRWETTLEEAGNVVALWDVINGHSWTEVDKTLFNRPYAQFLRVETDFTKTWQVSTASTLVAHLNAGILHYYGNSDDLPFCEMFYVGGANSIRAFPVRGIGPGAFDISHLGYNRQYSYQMQNGDLKLVANLEYRPRLFGNLEGAVFLDAGNVWMAKMKEATVDFYTDLGYSEEDATAMAYQANQLIGLMKPKGDTFFDQIAVGTGIGLRYNMGFLVIRIDWGLALHLPYNTGKSGYFNVNRFKDAQNIHFAIGYPF